MAPPTSSDKAPQPPAAVFPEEIVDRLAAFEPTDMPMVSLYLDTRPDERGRERWDVFFRKEFLRRVRSYPAHAPERLSLERDGERIEQWLLEELSPSANAAAIFAATASDVFEAVQLAALIPCHELYIDRYPHLYPLARVDDQYRRYAVALLDTNAAHLYVFGQGRRLQETDVRNAKLTRSSQGGWSQARYQRHIDNIHLKHAKEVVDALERIVREERVEHLVLAGDEVAVPLVREQLPKYVAERVTDVLHLPVDAPEHEVARESLERMRQHDAADDRERVGRLLDSWRAGGLAVIGAEDTLTALEIGQANEMVIAANPDGLEETRGLAGEALASELVRLARHTAARQTFIEDADLLGEVGGVGAFLRYRLPGGTIP